MRFPSRYRQASIGLCGFVLNHDDSIETDVLTKAYQEIASRWKSTFMSDCGQNVDRKYLKPSIYHSSGAAIRSPVLQSSISIYISNAKRYSTSVPLPGYSSSGASKIYEGDSGVGNCDSGTDVGGCEVGGDCNTDGGCGGGGD